MGNFMATKTVNSFAELKSAIEDTGTTFIEIAADITFSGEITVTWNEEEGILLSFDEEEEYKKGNYSATLN